MELVPLSGEGLITPFAVNTFGWTDEAESGAMDGMDVFFCGDDFPIVMIIQWYPLRPKTAQFFMAQTELNLLRKSC
jgi:hypothetical protein